MPIIERTQFLRVNQRQTLLSPELQVRDLSKRFSHEEKYVLAQNIKEVWASRRHSRNVPLIDIKEVTKTGYFKDEEIDQTRKPYFQAKNGLDIIANLETLEDFFNLHLFLDHIGNPETNLATMFFPSQRADRTQIRINENKEEMEESIPMRTMLHDFAGNNIRSIITSGSHSPAFAYFALEAGIAVVDVNALPTMFDFAVKKGLFEGKTVVPVTGDAGVSDQGKIIEKLTKEHGIDFEPTVHAEKTKANKQVTITFNPKELERVKGKTVVIPEDIISTGKTMVDTINQVLAAGAEEVIIMVPYPIFANSAIVRFANKEKVTIITTEGKTPMVSLTELDGEKINNIFQIPILEQFARVMGLDRQGIDLWSEAGKQALRQIGFYLNPWMDTPGPY